MATQTSAGILERFEAVLEAPPCLLRKSQNPFTTEAETNIEVGTTYRLIAGGVVNDRPTSGWQCVRLERIIVTVQQRLNFDGYQAQRNIQDLCDTIERAIVADGPDHSYHVSLEKGGRKVTRPKDTDLCEAAIAFLVDYDFDSSQS